ncbi:MAG: 6-phosphofructokinase, partial [Rhodothermales bacterium]|nr:6-phosphofructokinase [Rhodothermales bacterium]
AEKNYGRMVAVRESRITSIPLGDVAGKTRVVPSDSPLVKAALSVGTSFGRADLNLRFDAETPTSPLS